MGKLGKRSFEPISVTAICIAFTLVAGNIVEGAESSALSSDWPAIIAITRLLLWSFTLSLVLLMVTLIGSALALKPLDSGEVIDVVLVDTVEDIGSTFDTLDRKLLAGYMSRDAHTKARIFLEGRARFDRRGPIIRREAA